MCDKCKETDCLISSNYLDVGADLRFDVENRQLDIQIGYINDECVFKDSTWDGCIDIEYCPFCGKRLDIELSSRDLNDIIKKIVKVEVDIKLNDDKDKFLVTIYELIDKQKLENDNELLINLLSEYYKDSVERLSIINHNLTEKSFLILIEFHERKKDVHI